jgi:putative peptidoglycan lipid II flippase
MSSSLLKSSGVVGGATLLSRVLGFVRDVLQAALFGAGAAMDAFFVAFRIPNLFRRMFAEGAFQQAFVPVLTQTRRQGDEEEVRKLIDVVAGTMGGFLLLITAASVLAAPLLMGVFAPGFRADPEKFEQAVVLLRWTFPYLMCMSLAALLSGILNAYGRFAVPALTPMWLNVCLIGAALWYAPSVEALAIAVFFAGFIQLAFLLPSVARLGLMPRPRWGWRDPQVRRIITLMLPIMLGASISQLSLLLDSIIASFLPLDGSVSWLWYADRLMEFPLGIFSIAIATVILPNLASHFASNDGERFTETLDWALRLVLLLGMPAALGLFLLAGPMVSTLFQHAAFTARDVSMTAWALGAYAFGFLGFSFVKILIPGFYARQQTGTPLRLGMIAFGIGMVLSISITLILLHLDFVAPHAGIAASTATAAWINASLLFLRLRRDGAYRPAAGWPRYLLQIGIASLAMSLFLIVMAGPLASWTEAPALNRILRLAGLVGGGALIYLTVLVACGLRPWRLWQRVGA